MVALLLAHEMSHDVLHHPTNLGDITPSKEKEAAADKMGAFIMMRSGYDLCDGRNLFKLFTKLYGDSDTGLTHPSNSYRYEQLSLPQCDKESN